MIILGKPFVMTPNNRILSIDRLRGLIMIIMALDHVRDFFHVSAMTEDPTNPATTTPILFFTRWITHFCAPGFVFLSGMSAFITGQKRTKKELSAFLFKRGLVIILFELFLFNLFFTFDPLYHNITLQVLWVIGVSMMLLSVLIHLSLRILFLIGIIMVAGHNLLDPFNDQSMSGPPIWYGLLHQLTFINYAPDRFLGIFYPILPWPGVMILGYCAGAWYTQEIAANTRRKMLIRWGSLSLLLFFVLRWINVYGDPVPWSSQSTATATILSFFNLNKYPPSLLFLCMTLGPSLLMLAWMEKWSGKLAGILPVYGQVPMFYYLLHFLLIHLLCTLAFFATGHHFNEAATGMILFRPNTFGYSLGIVYLIWIGVVMLLYPLCKRYGAFKQREKKWWTQYL
jgi:uncharacterized membrane protein